MKTISRLELLKRWGITTYRWNILLADADFPKPVLRAWPRRWALKDIARFEKKKQLK
jgi:hypothetical protein